MELQFLDHPRERKIGFELTERILKKSLSVFKITVFDSGMDPKLSRLCELVLEV